MGKHPPPLAGNPAVYPAGAPRAGEQLFKITLVGTNAKAKYNEDLVQKTGTVKRWCAGKRNWGQPRSRPRRHPLNFKETPNKKRKKYFFSCLYAHKIPHPVHCLFNDRGNTFHDIFVVNFHKILKCIPPCCWPPAENCKLAPPPRVGPLPEICPGHSPGGTQRTNCEF
jgi:hypothetical protein